MSRRDDVEVVGRAIVLVILGASQEFLVVHDPKICSLNGVVGIKGVRNPMLAVVVSMSCYLHFVSYAVTLASFCTIGLDWRRLSSCIVSWVWSGVPLDVGSVGCVVDDVDSGIGWGVCRGISYRVSLSISCSISSGIDRLHHFIFSSSLFSHWLEGTLAATSLARMFRSTPKVGTCCGSAVSRTSFFDLCSGDANVGLEPSDCWRIFEAI
jgi:hypothetical protein